MIQWPFRIAFSDLSALGPIVGLRRIHHFGRLTKGAREYVHGSIR